MKHDIECALNAIECARQNLRDANLNYKNNAFVYFVAHEYIDDQIVTCECEQRLIERIKNEIRELYTNIHNFEFKCERIHDTSMFHVLFTFDEFINNETYKYVESMIVETNNVSQRDAFKNFYSLNNLYI